MMTGLYWKRNKIRQLKIRKSESKRSGRKQRDIKRGYEKMTVLQRENRQEKERRTDDSKQRKKER